MTRTSDATAPTPPSEQSPTGIDGISFPRLLARTGSFRLGSPSVVGFAHEGATVLFLRSRTGTDRTRLLWALDVASGAETLLADPADLLADAPEELSDSERSRRERSRESGSGIVSAALDATGTTVAFALSSRLFVLRLGADPEPGSRPRPRELATASAVLDPRPDPTGRWIAYVGGGALRVTAVDGTADRALAEPDTASVTWGVAEYNAAEDMGRARGFWWAPDGSALLAARVEESAVALRTVADPSRPLLPAHGERYPFAGTANPEVTLWFLPVTGGSAAEIAWDHDAFPYLTAVSWASAGPPLLAVQTRDQRDALVLSVDPGRAVAAATEGPHAGRTAGSAVPTDALVRQHDPFWVDPVAGTPAWLPGGRVLTVVVDPTSDTYRLAADGVAFSPAGLQLEAVLDVGPDDVLAVVQEDPLTSDLALLGLDGSARLLTGPHADPPTPAGVHGGRREGRTLVVARSGPDRVAATVVARRAGGPAVTIRSLAVEPTVLPVPETLLLGARRLRGQLFLPTGHGEPPATPASGPARLPVLLAPYGGPGRAMVRAVARSGATHQWWADQGFAVLVVDGRGAAGRGPAFDRMIDRDFAGAPLDDQVEALTAAAAMRPELDLSRVAIHGWSFGGYLAALAVLRRPDVFAAAVAGAPPVDWRLYSTYYTERYLGHPDAEPEVYARNGLLEPAAGLSRPLMIIHGLADDNVLVAHSLALSGALLEAGRPHTFLPLSGVTHMTSDETVAENLLLLQRDFLRSALGLAGPPGA